MSTIAELLSEIEKAELILPEFQRGFVWSPTKVKAYIESIYKNYPTGHFLIWKTYKPQKYRGESKDSNTQYYRLILDGQQRLTALYTVFRGVPPPFFEDSKLYFRIYFNVLTQEFEYWQPVKMRGKPEWIELTPFLNQGVGNFFEQDVLTKEDEAFYFGQLRYLNRLDQMRNYSYEMETIPKSGEEMDTDEVVRIFNLVNSSGMTLSKADLALAHICASWPDARENLKSTHSKIRQAGFNLASQKGREFEFWVRSLAAVATDSVLLDASFYKRDIEVIKGAWPRVSRAAEYLVNILRTDAYIYSSSRLNTPYVLVPLIKHLSEHEYAFSSEAQKRHLLYWLYAAQMWGRYSGSMESDLQRDIRALSAEDGAKKLISNVVSKVGRIKVEPRDLKGKGKGSPFFNIAYVAACGSNAIDWFNGMKLYTGHLGANYGIEIHHIFPTSRLYKEGGLDSNNRADIAKANEIANLAFLTKEANLKASDNLPSVYLPRVLNNYPSALRAQFVPGDSRLWEIENYDVFLEERRRLLADGINTFMEELLKEDTKFGVKNIADLVTEGESSRLEFKSSLRWDYKLSQPNKALELVAMKTIAGFLNTNGGTLLIGIDDSRQVIGIEQDYETLNKVDRDGYELHLNQLISNHIGKERCLNISISFHELGERDVCMVQVDPSPKPAYLKEGQESRFYIRTGNQTQPLGIKESHDYILEHWPV
ncbi:MAG: DUF262 domain-containing protein [Dehalococcoidia bacterium]